MIHPASSHHYFNPRTREGCDIIMIHPASSHHYFNPRTREGCDAVQAGGTANFLRDFNPRTREGCDPLIVHTFDELLISIHAPVKGATKDVFIIAPTIRIFQSTHP